MAFVEILTLVHCADHIELIIAGVNMLSMLGRCVDKSVKLHMHMYTHIPRIKADKKCNMGF